MMLYISKIEDEALTETDVELLLLVAFILLAVLLSEYEEKFRKFKFVLNEKGKVASLFIKHDV